SGFIVFVPKDELVELEMSIEDALKMIVSLGVVVPRWHPAHPAAEEQGGAATAAGSAAGPPVENPDERAGGGAAAPSAPAGAEPFDEAGPDERGGPEVARPKAA